MSACGLSVYSLSGFLLQITYYADNTKCYQRIIFIPGWWLRVEAGVLSLCSHCFHSPGAAVCKHTDFLWTCEYLTASVSLPDVQTVEARRTTFWEAGRGLTCCGSRSPTHRSSHGAQHIVAPGSPAAGPGAAHLPHDSSSAGCVWLLRLDCAHPHLSPGNSFQAAQAHAGVGNNEIFNSAFAR